MGVPEIPLNGSIITENKPLYKPLLMARNQTKNKICPVIGVFLPMVLIYTVFRNQLQISSYYPLLNSFQSVMPKSNKRQISKRRVLAKPSLFPEIPLNNTDLMFRLYSVVPVRSQETFAGASLAIIGETAGLVLPTDADKTAVTADDNYGKHFVKYNDHSVDQVFKVRKYTKAAFYGHETIWYTEMPEKIAQKMFNPHSTYACTMITVLLGENETMLNGVADLNVCHNPSVLPQPENKVDTAYCINSPPFSSSENDNSKEDKLSGGMALVVPNILYHLHSGVDLFVIYIPFPIHELYLRVLEPIIERYGHQLLFVDLSFGWRGNGEGNWELQRPLSQDCLNRLKGHSRFFRTIDVDEFDMAFSHPKGGKLYTPKPLTFKDLDSTVKKNWSAAWDDENYKMPYIMFAMSKLKSQESHSKTLVHIPHMKNFQAFDCLKLNHFWFIREGKGNELILPNTKTYIPLPVPKYGKCFCRPEKIALTWTHLPSNCFGGDCRVKNINIPEDNKTNDNSSDGSKKKDITELGYAHIREREWPSVQTFLDKQKAEGHLFHTSLFNEVVKKLEDELIELYGTAVPADLLKAIK